MRVDLERRIRELLDASDRRGAAVAAIRGYGPEVLGYLVVVLRDRDDAHDVFGQFSEELWKSIGEFRGEASFRTWAYGVAWNAVLRFRRARERRRERRLATSEASHLAAEVRSQTASYLKTASRNRLALLRASLDDEQQTLLTLRIDRGLSWREVASVLSQGGDAVDEAAARKRFERLKAQLRALASKRRAAAT